MLSNQINLDTDFFDPVPMGKAVHFQHDFRKKPQSAQLFQDYLGPKPCLKVLVSFQGWNLSEISAYLYLY